MSLTQKGQAIRYPQTMSTKSIYPKHYFWIFFFIFAGFFLYYVQDLASVSFLYWDETYYINAARAYLNDLKPFPNPEHPLFGKELMALSILLLGDGPVGWRFCSVFFGALTGTLVSYLVFKVTKRWGVALFVAALFLLDPLWLVHARVATLDITLAGLLVLAVVLDYEFYASDKLRWGYFYLLCFVLGLAMATKMLTLLLMPIFWGLVELRICRESKRFLAVALSTIALAVIPLLVFFFTYWVLGYSTGEFWGVIKFMFGYHQFHKGPEHLFSRWFEWLYIKNPFWFFWKWVDTGHLRAILTTGNFVLWSGAQLGAIYVLIRNWRRPELWMFALLVLVQFVIYSQKPSTFLFYMTGILPFLYILLGAAIGDLFDRYGRKYRRILQLDFAVFFGVSLYITMNYWPLLWGKVITAKQYYRIIGKEAPPSAEITTIQTHRAPFIAPIRGL